MTPVVHRGPLARTGLVGLVGLLLVVVLGATASAAPAPAAVRATRPGRLLVISLPGLTWQDVLDHPLPALDGFFARSALADLAPRGVHATSAPGEAYLTISAGARATTGKDGDGRVLAVDDTSGGSTAGQIFSRRTGAAPAGGYVSLDWPDLVRANKSQPYSAVLGLLTSTLGRAGVSASAIGNGDGADSGPPSYGRQVGLALADESGSVPTGALGTDLLRPDPTAPFGVRLDQATVLDRFRTAWAAATPAATSRGGVVVVEASDLARALTYRPTVSAGRSSALWSTALADADHLVAGLLADVDLTKDSVLVVAPFNGTGDRDLTAVALHRPGMGAGYLRSASTQRDGFLTLVDIAPTVLDTFGIDRPPDMEGRPAELAPRGSSLSTRAAHLATVNAASRFRERLLVPTTAVAVLGLVIVTALGVAALAGRWRRPWPGVLRFSALVDITLLPSSYLARGFPLERLGIAFYWAFLAGAALVLAAGATAIAARANRPHLDLVLVLAVVAGVLVGDVVSGSHLSLSAAFGYSPTGNSRLFGISNYSYGMLATAVCVLAGLRLAARPDRRGRATAIGLLVATLVIEGVPVWGLDVGGVLAFTPTLGLFVALVYGWRLRMRAILVGGLATLVTVTAFGLLDLSRPADQRGHLGRLYERIGNEGLSPLFDLISRKLSANLTVSTSSFWVAAIPVAALFGWFLVSYPTRPLDQLRARFPGLAKGGAAAVFAAALGSVVNDSGAIIGGVAAVVLTAAVLNLCLLAEP